MNLHHELVHAVTEYDRRESTKQNYNVYALAHYIGRVHDIERDIEAGAEPRAAVIAGFQGRLCDYVLRTALKQKSMSPEERAASNRRLTYSPVTERTR